MAKKLAVVLTGLVTPAHLCMQLFDSRGAACVGDQEHYLLLADGFVLVYEITSRASFDLVVSIKQKISSKNKEVCNFCPH